MLLFSTKLDKSEINGIGVFTNEFIPKGSKVWEFNDIIDSIITISEYNSLPKQVKEHIDRYGYYLNQYEIIMCGDHGKHINHIEDNPNLIEDENTGFDIADRDIFPGEELTSNYKLFDHGLKACGSFLKY